MNGFVNLHVQSHYSLLRAVPTIDELVSQAKEFNQPALALTDFNNMFAVPEFKKLCKSSGITPIFGLKLEIMSQSRFSSQRKDDIPIPKHTLILLAKSYVGYQNLLKISTLAYDDGSFGRFCADKSLLSQYSEDIIALSSDHEGELYHFAFKKDTEGFLSALQSYKDIFGENFYIEIQDRGLENDKLANKFLIEQAQHTHTPLVATNPVLYLKKDDKILLDIVSCIREKDFLNENTSLEGNNYFKSSEEIFAQFKEIPEAINNSLKIAEQCHINFPEIEDQSPPYPVPQGMTPEEFLREKSFKELREKFKGELPLEYEKRLSWELDTVCQMGFPNYFLVVSDFVQYAKKSGILVGPGRGSAAGALLAYALSITNVDPLQYDLLFERFLNPERVSMPDIDIDFEDSRRDEVKQYLRTYYGAEKTADVITFGYNKAKAVTKDVGRVLEIPLPRVNQITGLLDANEDLSSQVKKISALKEILESSNTKEKLWIQYSIKLCNRIRNLGTHASALIVAGNILNTIIPLYKDRSNTMTTGFEGKYLEENGLLKMDILGLSNLTIIKDCLHRIYKNHQVWIDLDQIDQNDSKVFQMFADGFTAGVFQFESVGMTNYIKQLKPNSIEDLIAMNALYRPGPMDNIPSFIKRKQGIEEIDCFHKNLEPILMTTYGVIVYQEQVMQIAQTLSGFSLGEADIVRRIMAKKKPDELEKVRPQWIQGAIEQGYEEKLAAHLFELLLPFSNYAFNKSHAAAYSILAYQIAWLKAHYPAEFMASLLTANMDKHEDLAKYIGECHKLGISVHMPDINQSYYDFNVEVLENGELAIRYGLGAIKGLGEQACQEIIKERHWGGAYLSVEDFIERTSETHEIRKASTELLLKAGAFDLLFPKDQLLQEKAIYLHAQNINTLYAKFEKKNEDSGMNLFSSDEMSAASENIQRNNIPPLTFQEEFQNEIKAFGFYLTKGLFAGLESKFGILSTYTEHLQEILPLKTVVSLLGYVNDIHIVANSNPRRSWGKFTLNTKEENFTFFVFGDKLSLVESKLNEGIFVYLKAQISERKEQRSYELEDIQIITENSKPLHGELNILIDNEKRTEENEAFLQELKKIAMHDYRNDAHHHLSFHIIKGHETKKTSLPSVYRINYPNEQLSKLLKHKIVKSFWFI